MKTLQHIETDVSRAAVRIAFPKWVELMKQLGREMAERLEGEIADILRRAPCNDAPTRTVNRLRKNAERNV